MNTKQLHTVIITTFVIFSFLNLCKAQFEMNTPGPGLDFGRTQFTITPAGNDIFSIGIGNFGGPLGLGLVPLSALHVNTNLMPASPNHGPGEVFRTDCPMTNTPFWRMLRGGTEQFALYNPANTNNVILQATQGNLILSDATNQVTLAELTELIKEVQKLKALLASKN